MATDYLLFIHGVTVQEEIPDNPTFADNLFNLIQQRVPSTVTLRKIPLYWGNVPDPQLNRLISDFEASSVWNQLWFREFRINQILPFVGEAAVYISRLFGSQVVSRLKEQAETGLDNFDPLSDRLHLVTHSWGTVILFDILFAGRWEDPQLPADARQNVADIRQKFFGLSPQPQQGIPLASFHTMGSPIALFSLISLIREGHNVSSHDISPALRELFRQLGDRNIPVPWNNFIHPGDPIAWPLEGVLRDILEEQGAVIEARDILTSTSGRGFGSQALNLFGNVLQGTFLSLVNGGNAHGSYWDNQQLAQTIAQTISRTINR